MNRHGTWRRGAWVAALGLAWAAAPPASAQRAGPQDRPEPPAAQPEEVPGAGAPPAGVPGLAVPAGPLQHGPTLNFNPPVAPSAAAATPPGEDIRDIRGPKFILPAWLIAAALAGLLALAALGYGLWRWLHRRRAPRPLLSFELALQRLEQIRPLLEPEHARAFSIAVSDIIRTYIEQRFDLVATQRTTEEFLHDLLATPRAALARHRTLLAHFLAQCDLVKFAGVSLTRAGMEALHASAVAFVRETAQPDPPAAAPPAAAPAPRLEGTHDSLPSA